MEIRVTGAVRKCGVCGRNREGVLMRSLWLDRLPPVFICTECLALAKKWGKTVKSADGRREAEDCVSLREKEKVKRKKIQEEQP